MWELLILIFVSFAPETGSTFDSQMLFVIFAQVAMGRRMNDCFAVAEYCIRSLVAVNDGICPPLSPTKQTATSTGTTNAIWTPSSSHG